ncbi:hypothetical protein Poly41_71550 [Novipirellula artificiosorum]|uniref:Uncharacterized protein n=1 Tax=Novipirellula artificiosorum TaxID=2528016 RepID=A0A5C6CCC2_9BACT|nr:hypothetical protein Poly41_71550 [Novipirellula artificiosorum]
MDRNGLTHIALIVLSMAWHTELSYAHEQMPGYQNGGVIKMTLASTCKIA